MTSRIQEHTAFDGNRRIASGGIRAVAAAVKAATDAGAAGPLLVFADATGAVVDLDLRGSLDDVLARLPAEKTVPVADAGEPAPSGPGRPKLGVVAREVTLLPRHWEWLSGQRGGASVTLRKLVEEASRAGEAKDRRRRAQEAAYRFMSAMAGNEPGYEEATRALFAGDRDGFAHLTEAWPGDIRDHATKLAAGAFVPVSPG